MTEIRQFSIEDFPPGEEQDVYIAAVLHGIMERTLAELPANNATMLRNQQRHEHRFVPLQGDQLPPAPQLDHLAQTALGSEVGFTEQ
ncbi:MAG: hypothetical protein JWM81_691 [Candidatus Saccharibacteria bacterium]|nr:hypothetical protein [Candidatus Saccharibacteria bacterium]